MNEQQLIDRLERLAEAEEHPDWDDVVQRAAPDAEPVARAVGRRRRRLVIATALVAALAACAALLPGRLGGDDRGGLVQGALAAVSQGSVLHMVLERPALAAGPQGLHPRGEIVDLATGAERPMMQRSELWYDPDRHLVHELMSVDGAVTFDWLQTPSGTRDNLGNRTHTAAPPGFDAGLGALLTGYRHALETGSATDAGPGKVDGRRVEWLRFPPPRGGGLAEEVAVDPDSYQAVAWRPGCLACSTTATVKFVTLEGIDPADADFDPPAPPGPRDPKLYAASYEEGDVAGASAFLGRRASWAGDAVGGSELGGVEFARPATFSSETRTKASLIATGLGLTLHYGTGSGPKFPAIPGRRAFTIAETADVGFDFHGFTMSELSIAGEPLTSGHGGVPPEGQIALSRWGDSWWVGQLRNNGLYVEIEAPSRALVLRVARALEPTP